MVGYLWEDEQWKENFRMNRQKFMWIVDRVRSRLERRSTRLHDPLPVDERLAVVLWFLANSITYRLVAQQFGLARSTVAVVVIEVCLALEAELLSTVVCPGPPAEVSFFIGILYQLMKNSIN